MGVVIEGRAALGWGARLARGSRLKGMVSLGPRCEVGEGAVLEDCVVLEGAKIGARAKVARSVLGQRCRVGPDAVVEGAAMAAGAVRAIS